MKERQHEDRMKMAMYKERRKAWNRHWPCLESGSQTSSPQNPKTVHFQLLCYSSSGKLIHISMRKTNNPPNQIVILLSSISNSFPWNDIFAMAWIITRNKQCKNLGKNTFYLEEMTNEKNHCSRNIFAGTSLKPFPWLEHRW